MWDEQDHFSRWVEGICGALALAFGGCIAAFSPWPWYSASPSSEARDSLVLGALYLAFRCFRYTLTGRDNINRDDF